MAWTHRVKNALKGNILTYLLISGVLFGVILGFVMRAVREEKYSSREVMYVGFPGEIFLQMLRGVAVPLMISCLISSIGSLDMRTSGRIGGQFMIYVIATKFESNIIAIILAVSLTPGANVEKDKPSQVMEIKPSTVADGFLDLGRNLFPSNLLDMTLRQYKTVLLNTKNDTTKNLYSWELKDGGEMTDAINMLGVVSISIIVGIVLGWIGEDGIYLLQICRCVSKVTMRITIWIMWTAPICVGFLITSQIVEMDSFGSVMMKLGKYIAVLFTSLTIQCFIVYPLIYFLFTRKNPLKFILNFSQALITAAATSSSNACIPFSIKNMIEKNHVDERVVEFIIPVGANVNKDGTSMFMVITVMYIAQINNVPSNFGDIGVLIILAATTSIATAGVPYSGIITLILILEGRGLPKEELSLLIAIDWMTDRYQTPINILGDAIGAGIIEHLNRKLLQGSTENDPVIETKKES